MRNEKEERKMDIKKGREWGCERGKGEEKTIRGRKKNMRKKKTKE